MIFLLSVLFLNPFFLDINVLDILHTDKLVLSLEAVEFIENRLCEDNRIITEPMYQFLTQKPYLQSHLDELLIERKQFNGKDVEESVTS